MENKTHSIQGGLNGEYIIIKDTTFLIEYESQNIDLDWFLYATVNITNTTTDLVYETGELYDLNSLRDVNGLKLYPNQFLDEDSVPLDIFEDGLYETELVYVFEDPNTLEQFEEQSENNVILYGIVKPKVVACVIDTDWKTSFGDIKLNYDHSIKLKSWLDNIILSNDMGLWNEGLRILQSLQKAIALC